MAIYVALGKFTIEGKKAIKESPERTKKVREMWGSIGAKIIGEYVVCGPYDVIRIIEGPDDIKKIMQVQAKVASMGTADWQTLPAIPLEEFDKLIS